MPSEIAFFDDDLKTQPIADALAAQGTPLGAYYNLTKLSLGMRELQFHDLVTSLIDGLPKDKFKVVVFDPFTRFENALQPVVQKNPTRFREFYSPMGAIKGAEIWKAAFDYEAVILDKLLSIAPLVIVTAHLKDQTIGAAKTGKEVPDCKKPAIEKSRLRIWLRHNRGNPAPIGLILKRLSKVSVGASGLNVQNVLPRKVTPCTWERLIYYWNNPIGEKDLMPDETPNEFELSILDGVLTEDQKDALHINAREADKPAEVIAVPVKVIPTFDQLVAQYGVDRVMAETMTKLPGSPQEWIALGEKLAEVA